MLQPPSVLLVPSVCFSEPIPVPKSIPVSPIPESHSEMAATLVPLGVLVEYEGMSWNPEVTPVPKFNPDFAHVPELCPELTSTPKNGAIKAPECSPELSQEPTQVKELNREPTQVTELNVEPSPLMSPSPPLIPSSPPTSPTPLLSHLRPSKDSPWIVTHLKFTRLLFVCTPSSPISSSQFLVFVISSVSPSPSVMQSSYKKGKGSVYLFESCKSVCGSSPA
ncbi:hypothetical protein G5714_008063 [Onychostoma macrolepis]|uniref:Uncharacterized protein n=1 Tax=Onychostoma macrolepis TaxID=369639 RepID=A0A7J6CYJ7_9TELE|nr:hypothetical protein G5714_008063 [Onychostoma macrolepis]